MLLSPTILFSALAGSALSSAFLIESEITNNLMSSCPVGGPVSCQNTSTIPNLCCFEAPGGLLVQTQFWDFSPPKGPKDSFTVHGLWPDKCDVGYPKNCDPSRFYKNISAILADNGAESTLEFMNEYWSDLNNHNEQFWEHEWSKHGTCMSTLRPQCLPEGSPPGLDAVAYFRTAEQLFKNLPTYAWLASAGIVPSASKTYSLDSLFNALTTASGGFTPEIECAGSGRQLKGVNWYFNLKGSALDGEWIMLDAPQRGSCRSGGIQYLPKQSNRRTATASQQGIFSEDVGPNGAFSVLNWVWRWMTD